jgi:hypothetical protein
MLTLKNKASKVLWHAPVPPATQEAEARGSLKPISSKPAWEIYRDLLLEKKRCLWI